MNVEHENIFKEFCRDRNLAPASIRLYRLALEKYTDFNKMSLDELIDEAENEEDTIPRLRKRKITKRLAEFKEHLDDGNLSQDYINHQFGLVRSFYNEFDIQLPRTRRRKARKDRKEETIEDLPTMDDIRKSLDKSNTNYKAIILVMLSSGMSRAEVPSLTFKHFYDSIPLEKYPKTLEELIDKFENEENIILYWRLKRIKTGKAYFTFTSPEASYWILESLKELHRKFPEYNPLPEDTFFRPNNIPLTPDTLSQAFRRINKRAGLMKEGGGLTVRPHMLRKVFATTLERNKFPHTYTSWLLGHSISNQTASYFKADPGAVKEEYIQIVDQLSVNEEVEPRTVTSEGFNVLEAELKNERGLREKLEKRMVLMEKLMSDKNVQEELNKR